MLEKLIGFIKSKKTPKVEDIKKNAQNTETTSSVYSFVNFKVLEDKEDRVLSKDKQRKYYNAINYFELDKKVENYQATHDAIEQMKWIMRFFRKYYNIDSEGKADNVVLKKMYDIIRKNSEIIEIQMPYIPGTIQCDKIVYRIKSIALNRETRRAISQCYQNYKDEIEKMIESSKHMNDIDNGISFFNL
jgi:hypothetical protein